MTTDTTISIGVIIIIIQCIINIQSARRNKRNDIVNEKQREVEMASNIAEINIQLKELTAKTADIARSYERLDDKIDLNSNAMTRQDERINSIYARQEDFEKRLANLEKSKRIGD